MEPGDVLLWASGTDRELVKSVGDGQRYRVLGALVLFSASLALIGASYAFQIAQGIAVELSLALALLWGLGILAIDRWITSTIIERDGFLFRLRLLAPRLLISVPASLVVAWFLLLGLAHEEITSEFIRQKAATVRASSDLAVQRAQAVAAKQAIDAEVRSAVADVANAQSAYDAECAGTGGTLIPGCGAVAGSKNQTLADAQTRLLQVQEGLPARIQAAQARIDNIDDQMNAEISHLKASAQGVFTQRQILSEMMDRNPHMKELYRLLEVLLISVDLSPVIAKTLSTTSRYDLLVRAEKRRIEMQLSTLMSLTDQSRPIVPARLGL